MSNFVFFKKFFTNPESTGTILPSSKFLGKSVCNVVASLPKVQVLEIGAGTGALTQHLLKFNPLIIEIEADLYKILKEKFPSHKIQNVCCLQAIQNQTTKFGLVSSIPTINNPIKNELISKINKKYDDGLLKWCVIYTYGLHDPFSEIKFPKHKRKRIVFTNFPPAHVWVYY